MNTEKLLERLQEFGFKGKPNFKNQWYTKCPFCEGNFSINLTKAKFICFSASCGKRGHLSQIIGDDLFQDDLSEYELNGSIFDFDFGDYDLLCSVELGDARGSLMGCEELDEFNYVHQFMLDRGFERNFLIQNRIGFDHKTLSITIPLFEKAEWGEWKTRNVSGLIYCGFIRRTVLNWVKPKYLYPDNFQRVERIYRPLVVNHKAVAGPRRPLNSSNVVFIVEGSLDALKTAQGGFNAISVLGCYASDAQIKKIEKICTLEGLTPILLFDNDNAGRQGVDRILAEFPHFNCKVAQMADLCYNENIQMPKDPGELEGRQLCELLEKSKDRMEYELAQIGF